MYKQNVRKLTVFTKTEYVLYQVQQIVNVT